MCKIARERAVWCLWQHTNFIRCLLQYLQICRIIGKNSTAGHLVIWIHWPLTGHLDTAIFIGCVAVPLYLFCIINIFKNSGIKVIKDSLCLYYITMTIKTRFQEQQFCFRRFQRTWRCFLLWYFYALVLWYFCCHLVV